jgi:hypothetical protein
MTRPTRKLSPKKPTTKKSAKKSVKKTASKSPPSSSRTHSSLDPFIYHGCDFTRVSDQESRCECPWCSHASHKFYVNSSTGQFHCKNCGQAGNTFTFLQKIWDDARSRTKEADFKELAALRGNLPWKTFEELGFALSRAGKFSRWLIPITNTRGHVVNLRTWNPLPRTDGKTHPIHGTTGLPSSLFNLQQLKASDTIFICEGEWDTVAFEHLLRESGLPGSVIGVPGAEIFKDEWKNFFLGRTVVFLYDNDAAGTTGQERGAFILQGAASNVHCIHWTSSFPEKFDIRDFVISSVIEGDLSHEDALDKIIAMCREFTFSGSEVPTHLVDSDLPTVKSFKEVLKAFNTYYKMDEPMETGLALMFATVLSTQLPGDPIWLFIVGPPGSGKTLLLKAFEQSPVCVFRSKITAQQLVSGWKAENDPSLLRRLPMKTLILKDWTEMMDMDRNSQDELYSLMRGAFDGTVDVSFGNGERRVFPDTHFSVLAGVTNAINGHSKASLGERFLKYQMVDTSLANYSQHDHIRSAIAGIEHEVEASNAVKRIVAGFSNQHLRLAQFPDVPKPLIEKFISLAMTVAALRTSVETNYRGDEVLYRPTSEVGTRLAKQFIKLARSLAVVYSKKTVDASIYKIIHRVALDTVWGWNRDIVAALYSSKSRMSCVQLAQAIRSNNTTISRRLQNLIVINIVSEQKEPSIRRGPKSSGFQLTPEFRTIYQHSLPSTK